MMTMTIRFASLPVLSVLVVLGFVYYATVFLLIDSWLGLQSSAGTVNGVVFTVLSCLALLSFFSCILTEPGLVPSGYIPDLENREPNASSGQQPKKCDKCHTYKPPRAHHCRICRRCILRMDHHCIWINNCVGHWNYKSFVNLVFYATVGSIYATVMTILCALQQGLDFPGQTTLKTLYYYESTRAVWLAKKSGQNYRHPFNLNFFKNVTLILGPNILKWLCPTAVSHLKDGTSYPTIRDS